MASRSRTPIASGLAAQRTQTAAPPTPGGAASLGVEPLRQLSAGSLQLPPGGVRSMGEVHDGVEERFGAGLTVPLSRF
jgi:hypothetical protein